MQFEEIVNKKGVDEMALVICDSCGKEIKTKWFPEDWIIVKYDNVLLNRVLCDKCKENA